MSRASDGVKRWRANAKQRLIASFGGKCNKCGYNDCPDALDLHHLKDKSFSLGEAMARPRKWEFMVEEAKKCLLLCSRCHRELHANYWNLEDIKVNKFCEVSDKTTEISFCPICGKLKDNHLITCSRSCAALRARKVERPSKELLLELKSKFSRNQIADQYGVSEAAVRKWEKKNIAG